MQFPDDQVTEVWAANPGEGTVDIMTEFDQVLLGLFVWERMGNFSGLTTNTDITVSELGQKRASALESFRTGDDAVERQRKRSNNTNCRKRKEHVNM